MTMSHFKNFTDCILILWLKLLEIATKFVVREKCCWIGGITDYTPGKRKERMSFMKP